MKIELKKTDGNVETWEVDGEAYRVENKPNGMREFYADGDSRSLYSCKQVTELTESAWKIIARVRADRLRKKQPLQDEPPAAEEKPKAGTQGALKLYNYDEAAELLSVSRSAIKQWVAKGELKAMRTSALRVHSSTPSAFSSPKRKAYRHRILWG